MLGQPPPTVIRPPALPPTPHEGSPTRAVGAPDGRWTAPEACEGSFLTLPSRAGTLCRPDGVHSRSRLEGATDTVAL